MERLEEIKVRSTLAYLPLDSDSADPLSGRSQATAPVRANRATGARSQKDCTSPSPLRSSHCIGPTS